MLRLYVRRPERAAVDAALLARLVQLLPVPPVLEARTATDDPTRPPLLVTGWLPGRRLDDVITESDAAQAARLGEAVGALAALVGVTTFARPGEFADATLDPTPVEHPLDDLLAWSRACLGERHPALLAGLEPILARQAVPLLELVDGQARLVHADLNPKNVLVDAEAGTVTGLLDWEFAYAGCPLADPANMVRFDSGSPYARAFVRSYGRHAPGLPADWLAVGRALDAFALVELAGRSGENPVATAALRLLEGTVRTGDLSAGRADPSLPVRSRAPERRTG